MPRAVARPDPPAVSAEGNRPLPDADLPRMPLVFVPFGLGMVPRARESPQDETPGLGQPMPPVRPLSPALRLPTPSAFFAELEAVEAPYPCRPAASLTALEFGRPLHGY